MTITYTTLPRPDGAVDVIRRDRYGVADAVAVCPTPWLADEVRAALQAAADAGDPKAKARGELGRLRRDIDEAHRELFERERDVEDAEDRLAELGTVASLFGVEVKGAKADA